MTVQIPYLPLHKLSAKMKRFPVIPFFMRPGDFSVIDGDTIRVLTPKLPRQRREEAFSIRFRSIATPEKPRAQMTDKLWRSVGVEPWEDNYGVIATNTLKKLIDGKCILIEPKGSGKYGRLLADVSVSGSEGKQFDLINASSLEWDMIDRKAAKRFSLKEDLPPRYPEVLRQLKYRLLHEAQSAELGISGP